MKVYKKQVKNKYKYSLKYNDLMRFTLYWYQLREVFLLEPKKVLEVGCGSKVVAHFLQQQGVQVKTLDIDRQLKPDYCGSVTQLSRLVKEHFDVILLGEILEHIEYADALKVLQEISITNKLVITVPYPGHIFSCTIKIPFLKEKILLLKIPQFYKKQKFTGEHYWELGKRDLPLQKFLTDINHIGWHVAKHYTIKHSPGHFMLVLEKK